MSTATCVPSPSRARPPRAAFTLIELLVVIAVISILAGMLIPTIRAVRRVAKATQCVNNVQQIGYTVSLYLEDNRDVCLPWVRGSWWASVWWLVDEYFEPNCRVWECPADDTNDCTPWDGSGHNSGDWYNPRRRCGYLYNNGGGSSVHRYDEGLSLRHLSEGYLERGKRLEEIVKPSKKMSAFCWSAHNFWSGVGPGRERMQWWHSDPPALKCPIACLDGHAENVTIVPAQPETDRYQW